MMKYLKITLLVFLEIIKKRKEKKLWKKRKKKALKKKLWKEKKALKMTSQLVIFRVFLFIIFFVPPTLGLKKKSRNSANKKNLA